MRFLYEKNVFIVMTHYATDKSAERLRKIQGVDVDAIIENTKQEIALNAGLAYDDVMVFMLDSLPLTDDEMQKNLEIRFAIMMYIASLDSIGVPSDLPIAKTECITQLGREKVKELEGEINGYKQNLIECEKSKDGGS